jgi:mono/diheme cytochrome c family protein
MLSKSFHFSLRKLLPTFRFQPECRKFFSERLAMKRAAILIVTLFASAGTIQAADDAPYKVVDGTKVDANTLKGWRTWRAATCERCHGPKQEGLVGPSLIDSLKVLSKEDFKTTVLKGRPERGMPNFDGSPQVVENIDNLYTYLKGRSDGKIEPGRLTAIDQ